MLEVDPSNAKALYRLGQALFGLKDYDEALEELSKARKLMPKDKNVAMQIEKVHKVRKDYVNSQRSFFSKSFA